eukprot:1132603-Amphidinium_carterae.1
MSFSPLSQLYSELHSHQSYMHTKIFKGKQIDTTFVGREVFACGVSLPKFRFARRSDGYGLSVVSEVTET